VIDTNGLISLPSTAATVTLINRPLPTAPVQLAVTPHNTNGTYGTWSAAKQRVSLHLSWNAVTAPNLIAYEVELLQGSTLEVRSVPSSQLYLDWSDALAGKVFISKIYARTSYGQSIASNSKTGTTTSATPG